MDRPRLIRSLRIAWSVVFGILCVLLIALWVRSYWWVHRVSFFRKPHLFTVSSYRGGLSLTARNDFPPWGQVRGRMGYYAEYLTPQTTAPEAIQVADNLKLKFTLGFWKFRAANLSFLCVPQWFIVLFAAILTAIPWLRWSFSLRTLLIATTLIAVVLGLVVWSVAP